VPHLPVHYPDAIDLFFGLLSKFFSPGIAWAFGSFSEEDIVFSFWKSPHFDKMVMTILTEIVLMMVFFVQNPSYKVKYSPRKVHILRGTC